MDNHPGKMEVYQIQRKNAIEWKPIKFKKQKKLARLKTRKGGLSKLEKKKKISQGWKPEMAVLAKIRAKKKKKVFQKNEWKKKKKWEWVIQLQDRMLRRPKRGRCQAIKIKTKWKESMKTNEKMMYMTRILARESMIEDVEKSSNASEYCILGETS